MTDERSLPDDLLRDDETPHATADDMAPPHGDELRSEVTFGRTDRYTNVDDEDAAREQPVEDPEGSRDTRRQR